MAEGRFEDACPRLARSNMLDPEVGTQVNLAHCYELLGRTASAWSAWKAAAEAAGAMKAVEHDEAERRKQADREAFARARVAGLEPHLLYVTLRVVDGGSPPPSVNLDGQAIPPSRWGVDTPVDPGVHSVTAQTPGRQQWFTQFEVAERLTPRVELVIPPLVAISVAEQGATYGPTSSRDWMRPAAVGTGATSLALGALGTGFGLAAIGAHGRAANDCVHPSNCAEERAGDLHQLDVDSTAADIAFAAAGAGVVLAAIFWFTAPRPRSNHLAVEPLLEPCEAAVMLSEKW